MQRLYELASRAMDRIFSFRRSRHSVSRRAVARMDPAVRRALAGDVSDEVHVTEDEWKALEHELAEALQQLRDSEAKEQFLGMRIYKYQQRLNDQARRLKEEQASLREREEECATTKRSNENEHIDHDDPEGGGEGDFHVEDPERLEADRAAWERRMVKWEEESDLLQSIQATHKTILVDCENMRRQIRSLEKRRLEFQGMQQECTSFVAKASQVRTGHDDPINGESESPTPEEVELSPNITPRPTTPETSARGDETSTLLVQADPEIEPPV